MFWHVDSEKMFNVDELISHADEYKSKARERKSSSSDIALLDEALEHVCVASNFFALFFVLIFW